MFCLIDSNQIVKLDSNDSRHDEVRSSVIRWNHGRSMRNEAKYRNWTKHMNDGTDESVLDNEEDIRQSTNTVLGFKGNYYSYNALQCDNSTDSFTFSARSSLIRNKRYHVIPLHHRMANSMQISLFKITFQTKLH